MLGRLAAAFKRSPTGVEVKSDDIAYAASALVYSGMFHSYNPDTLLTRKGYSVYREMMTDEQVKAVVRFHRDAVTGREWSFQDHPALSDAENDTRRIVMQGIIAQIPGSFKTRLDMVMSSLTTGFSMVEKTYDLVEVEGKQWMGIKSLRRKPFDTFHFKLDDYGNLIKLEQETGGNRSKLDLKKFIHHVHNADVHEYYGQSELREAYRAWWSKDTTLLLQNIFLERTAAGFIYAQPTAGKTLTPRSDEYAQLKSVLSSIRSNSAVIFPAGLDINIVHPNDTQAFERAVQAHDKAISKALLMPNLLGLSEQGPNGSRALGDTQLEAFLWMLDAEAKDLEECINEQLFQELAELNFSDGLYPRWTLHELSNKQKMEVVDKWVALTGAKAVKSNDVDEAHLRTTLGFPVQEENEDEDMKPVDPATALTGVQVTSMMEVVDRVASERIPREVGIAILVNSFPISRDQAEEIMGTVGNGFEPKEKEPILLPGEEPKDEEEGGDQNIDDDSNESDGGEGDQSEGEETIIGKSRNRVTAKHAAARARVAFAVIDAKANDIEAVSVDSLSSVVLSAIKPVVDSIPDEMTAQTPQEVNFSSKDKTKIKSAVGSMLSSSWQLGVKHAKDEVSKAKGEIMSVNFARLDQDAADFFDAKSFTITGKLTADMIAIIQNTLSNSIKESATRRDTIDTIYDKFAAEGFITPEDAQGEMQRLLTSKESATARLSTVVRTNSFEAINEARYSYFTDPELSNFVEALEYTAILDSRTTQICQHLDGQVHAADGEVWNGPWRPPNHFNCRSLLIPVTQFDRWAESPMPEQQPQSGFGGA